MAGEWRHSSERPSSAGINAALYRSPEAVLSVRSDADRIVVVYVDFGATAEPLSVEATVRVRSRFDDGAPIDESWRTGPDGRGAFAPDPIAFARALIRRTTLVLEFPDGRAARSLRIDLAGAATAVRPVLANGEA